MMVYLIQEPGKTNGGKCTYNENYHHFKGKMAKGFKIVYLIKHHEIEEDHTYNVAQATFINCKFAQPGRKVSNRRYGYGATYYTQGYSIYQTF